MINIVLFTLAVGKHIPMCQNIQNFILPQPRIHQISFFLILWGKQAIFNIILPCLFEFLGFIGVIPEVYLLLLHLPEVRCNRGDSHRKLIINDDIQNLCSQVLALNQQHNVWFIQSKLLLYLFKNFILIIIF